MAGNPFNVTKAVDFSDEQIANTWVDFKAEEGGFFSIADPRSPMPRILIGGKGTGRTHLMRYYSAALQRLRHPDNPLAIIDDGYLGIYLRCSGLNSGRFAGKGISDDGWADVFAYYMDLWLAQLAVATARATFGALPEFLAGDTVIAARIADAFDEFEGPLPTSVVACGEAMNRLQRDLDLAINNASLSRELTGVRIRSARGRLPATVPQAFADEVPALATITWLYLLDELENLTEEQQRYVQTLIREKEPPASFMIGTRRYGFRTRRTFSADEENKEGSEFEVLELDRVYFDHFDGFKGFCRDLIAQRLIEEHFAGGQREVVAARLDDYFQTFPLDDTSFVTETSPSDRRYFRELGSKLRESAGLSEEEVGVVVEALAVPDKPLFEKLNVLMLFQQWRAGWSPVEIAGEIGELSRAHAAGDRQERYAQSLRHHGPDMHAQLLRQYSLKQRYLGLDAFIRMAGGLPRNLLIILKNIYRWALFNGERAFAGDPISDDSQRSGVLEASSWFLKDSLVMGELGTRVEDAVRRIGGLLRALRFADRPSEIKLSTFTVDVSGLSGTARETIEVASKWSLLVPISGGQRDRNSGTVVDKYQLNPMICPQFDLPLVRGGALRLNSEEAEAIFAPTGNEAFEAVLKMRTDRATVPFRNGRRRASGQSPDQVRLLPDE